MKIQRSRRQETGSILVITIILLVIIGTTLASYLLLSSTQAKSVVRSQKWNCSLDMAEAGIEEALAHMNNSPNDFSANSWTVGGGGLYGPMRRELNSGYYWVSIQTNPVHTIYATGYVTLPLTGATLSRKVKVKTLQLPLFNVAFAAQDSIDMAGNGAATDSFNSRNTSLSNSNMAGFYDPSRTSTNGNAASEEGVVNIGNHTIVGSLYLGPEATYMSSTGQVTGTIFYDYNVQFPPIVEPTTLWDPAPTIGTKYVFTMAQNNGYYQLSGGLNKDIVVQPGVTVTLMIASGSFDPGYIDIQGAPTNSGTLIIYQRSGTVDISGNDVMGGARPENFIYFGETGVTSIVLAGTSVIIGCFYAPNANLSNKGGGSGVGFIGSCIVGSITMDGHYDFHYDEALAGLPYISGHVPSSWQEL